jgi:hypothetical protein
VAAGKPEAMSPADEESEGDWRGADHEHRNTAEPTDPPAVTVHDQIIYLRQAAAPVDGAAQVSGVTVRLINRQRAGTERS